MRIWRIPRLLPRLAGPLLLAVALTACGAQADVGKPAAASGEATSADRVEPLATAPVPQLPATVRSADGRTVTVGSADRIVPLTGGLSEIVFTLGLGKNVVARDITATFDQAKNLPVITRAHDVSAEGVLSLHPTVVLADTSTGPAEAVQQIRAAGIPLIVLGTATRLGDVGPRIDAVAAALGVKASGDELRKRTADRIAAVTRTISAPTGQKPKVAFLYLRGTASVYLLGGAGSGADSLIEAAGAVDAGKGSGLTKDFTPITSEALVKAAPDVILVMTKGLESVGGPDGLEKVPGVAQTPAGMDRRIVAIDDGTLLNFGPRTDRVLRQLVDGIHNSGAGR